MRRDGLKTCHCPVTGWQDSSLIVCADIVPEELSHLYGVRDLPLRDPKNGTMVRFVSFVQRRKANDENNSPSVE